MKNIDQARHNEAARFHEIEEIIRVLSREKTLLLNKWNARALTKRRLAEGRKIPSRPFPKHQLKDH